MTSAINNQQGEITVKFTLDVNSIYVNSPTMFIYELGGVSGSDGISLIKDSSNALLLEVHSVNNNYVLGGVNSNITYPLLLDSNISVGDYSVTVKWNTTGVYGYLNGVAISSESITINIEEDEMLTLGSRYDGTSQFKSRIDVFRISNITRNDSETLNDFTTNSMLEEDQYTTFRYINPQLPTGDIKSTEQFTILDFNDINISTVEPSNPIIDQLWLDISIVPNQLKRWNGSWWMVVNNVRVGGRNLLKGTRDFNSTYWSNISTKATSTLDANYSMVQAKGDYTTSPATSMATQGFKFIVGETYTISVMARTDVAGSKLGVTVEGGRINWQPQDVTSTWTKLIWTFESNSDALSTFRFETQNISNIVYITQPKIELGNLDTDYSQAPEDIQGQLDTVNSDLYTPTVGIKDKLSTTVSELNIAKTDITAKVGKTEIETYKNKNLKVRYIRDWTNGSNVNAGNHWIELKAMSGKTNRASGKTPTSNQTLSNGARITDGVITSGASDYAGGTDSTNQYIQIDLGQVYEDLDYVQVWHYWADGRTYHGTKVQVSEDGVGFITIFDSAVSGEYRETSGGFIVPINTGWALNTINSRIADAELKITDNAITATVRNHADYQGDLNNLGGKNKWLVKKYPRTPVGVAPTFDLIANTLATQTVELTDRTSIYPSNDASIFGSTTNDNYLGVATTYVYCTSAFVLNTSVMHDNGGSIYLNNVSVYSGNSYISTPVATTLNLQKGWNRIDLLWEEATGGDGFSLGTTLSTNGNISNMSCYYNIESVAESRLKIAEDQIGLRVQKNNVISEINQTSEVIKISASKIDITGAVTFNSFDSTTSNRITDMETTANDAQSQIDEYVLGNQVSQIDNKFDTLFHYDTNLCATKGTNPNGGYVATLRPIEGKFNGCVAIEEGTVNLVSDPSLWNNSNTTVGTSTLTKETYNICGISTNGVTLSQGLSTDIVSINIPYTPTSINTNTFYTISCYVNSTIASPLKNQIRVIADGVNYYLNNGVWSTNSSLEDSVLFSKYTTSDVGKWKRISYTLPAFPAGTITSLTMNSFYRNSVSSFTCKVANFQIEMKPFASSFVNGTRGAGNLWYNKDVLPTTSFTIAGWFNALRVHTSATGTTGINTNWYFPLIELAPTTNRGTTSFGFCLAVEPNTGGSFRKIQLRSPIGVYGTTSIQDDVWYHIVTTWDGGAYKVYVNGVLDINSSTTTAPQVFSDTVFMVGGNYCGKPNSLIDELYISPKVLTATEIMALYNLQQPFYDANPQIVVPTPTISTFTIS